MDPGSSLDDVELFIGQRNFRRVSICLVLPGIGHF